MRRQVKLVTPHQEADAVLFIFLSGFRNRYSGKKIYVFETNPLLLALETKRKSYNKTGKKGMVPWVDRTDMVGLPRQTLPTSFRNVLTCKS